jgi:hypothetical protein
MIRRRAYIARSSKRIPVRRRGHRANLSSICAELWSRKVRAKNGGRCVLASYRVGDGVPCYGPIDPAHCFGKKAHPAVKYEVWNGEPVCRRHHDMLGNGETWRIFLFRLLWGPDLYQKRYWLACQTRKLDYDAIRAELTA